MIGKWNKSVILTYIGFVFSIIGIILITLKVELKYAIVCLMYAGICDLFDGTVARKCKRTKEEKEFGIELDSIVDVMSFIAFPIVVLATINTSWYFIPIAIIYSIFAAARLAYFNIKTADKNKAVSHYIGLPVTFAALIFPIVYLLSYFISSNLFVIIYNLITFIVAILFILKIKVPKPKLLPSIMLIFLAIILTIVYLFLV